MLFESLFDCSYFLAKIGEIYVFDAACGADLCAFAAEGAKRIVDHGAVVTNGDRRCGTILFTLATADAGVGACLAGIRALVVA